jgi:hypothetical protein
MYFNDLIQEKNYSDMSQTKNCGMISHKLMILSITSRRHGVEKLQCG